MTERFSPFAKFRALPLSPVQAGYIGGKMRVLSGEYKAKDLAPGNGVTLAWLPEGAIVLDALLWHDALGTGTYLALGDDEDDSRYISAVSAQSNDKKSLNQAKGFLYRAPVRRCIKLTVSGAAASGEIKLALIYSLE